NKQHQQQSGHDSKTTDCNCDKNDSRGDQNSKSRPAVSKLIIFFFDDSRQGACRSGSRSKGSDKNIINITIDIMNKKSAKLFLLGVASFFSLAVISHANAD